MYSTAVWDIKGEPKEQKNLVVSPPDRPDEPEVVVDNLEIAQLMYLFRENKKVREVLNAVTSKLVLILGRFGERKKYVLEPISDMLRRNTNYLPLILDFEPPEGRDVLHTVQTLALLSRFVLVDLTEPKSAPYELNQIAPLIIPIQPLLQASEEEPVLLEDLRRRCHWVLEPHYYGTVDSLLESLRREIITSIEAKVVELQLKTRV